jgi:transcriptional regulator with XRE-family HTH domain
MTLGDRLRALRGEMSRASLAHDAGVSYAFVQQLETGVRKDPGVKSLSKVAAVLGVSVDALLDEADTPGQPETASNPRPAPARKEIEELLDAMSADELVAARDMLRVWVGATSSELRSS